MSDLTARMSRRELDRMYTFVEKDRCRCCGHRKITWSPKKIVECARAWTIAHGRVPLAPEWSQGTAEHPAQSTVCNVFGSWNAMLNAAGLADRATSEREKKWTRQMVVDAMLDFRAKHGRWPTWREWAKAKGRGNMAHPSSWTVRKLFGDLPAAREYAAGVTDPSLPGNGHLKIRRAEGARKDSPAFASTVEPCGGLPVPDGGAGEPPVTATVGEAEEPAGRRAA